MTVQVSELLRELADDRPPSAGSTHDGDAARAAWTRSRQVRRRRRAAGAAAVVVGALLIVPLVSSLSGLRAERPVPGEVPGVVGIPDHLYPVPALVDSVREAPGTPAALAFVSRTPQHIAGWHGDGQGAQSRAAILVSATSDDYTGFPAAASFVALSPDGRRAAVVTGDPYGTRSESTLSLVDLVTGSSVDHGWPGTTIESVIFSPDGTQLAMAVGVPMEGSDSARNGHIYVLGGDGSTHDVAETFQLAGWLPGGHEVVVGLEDSRLYAVSATGNPGGSATALGPPTEGPGEGIVSPDGLLVARAGVSSSTQDSTTYRLSVTRIADGTTVRAVDYADVLAVQVVGWSDDTTPVVGVWSNNDTSEGLLIVEAVGAERVPLSSGPSPGEVGGLAAAQGLLATVRPAGPPAGVPWFTDARSAAWHMSAWFGMTPRGVLILLLVVGLVALPIALVLLNNRRVRRRDPEAYIR